MSVSAGKCHARHPDEVRAAPQLQVLTPQYDTLVTWLAEIRWHTFFTAGLSPLSVWMPGRNPCLASALHFVPCHRFRLAFFLFLPISCYSFFFFFPHREVAAAAAGFLPEQFFFLFFFKLFTRRLAALTVFWEYKSRRHLACPAVFPCPSLKPSNNLSLLQATRHLHLKIAAFIWWRQKSSQSSDVKCLLFLPLWYCFDIIFQFLVKVNLRLLNPEMGCN